MHVVRLPFALAILVIAACGRSAESEALMRPLDHEIDARCAGRLVVTATDGVMLGETPAGVAALAALERLAADAAARSYADVGAYLDAHERMLWLAWWPRAEQAAQAVLGAVPDHPRALALLSAVRAEQGRRSEAQSLADRALALDGEQPLALAGRALAASARGDFLAAQADLQHAMDAAPGRPEAPWLLGTMLFDRNRFAEAAPHLRRVLPHIPDLAAGKGPYIATALGLAELLDGRAPHVIPVSFRGVDLPLQGHPELPAVAVRIGSQQGWFVIDTGAAMTRLQQVAAGSARLIDAPATFSATTAGMGRSRLGLLPELRLGELTLADVPVMIDTGEVAPLGPGILGSLGISLLREFDVTLDTGTGRLRLDPPGNAPRAVPGGPRFDVPFEIMGGVPIVMATLGAGPPLHLIFDTGANGLFLDPAVAQARFGISLDELPDVGVTGATGQEMRNAVFDLPVPLVIGGEALPISQALLDPGVSARAAGMRITCEGTLAPPVRASYLLDFRRQMLTVVGEVK